MCIAGVKLAYQKGIRKLEVIGDSNLVISQASGDWQVKGENLKPYHQYLDQLMSKFESITFTHTLRSQNRFADALTILAAMTHIPEGIKVKPLRIKQQGTRIYEGHVVANAEITEEPWYEPLQRYMETGEYPIHFRKKEKRALRQYATGYVIIAGRLYKRSFHGQNMMCISQHDTKRIMDEVHAGVC